MMKQRPKERFAAKVDDLSWRTHRIGFVAHLFHFIFVSVRHIGGQKGEKTMSKFQWFWWFLRTKCGPFDDMPRHGCAPEEKLRRFGKHVDLDSSQPVAGHSITDKKKNV